MQNEQRFLDSEGRVKQWPTKSRDKLLVLGYLSSKFEIGRSYSEQEVNEVLKSWHTFNDWPLLRRELYDRGFMTRNQNGSGYKLYELKTGTSGLVLAKPSVERDAPRAVEWLEGSEGRETLRLMGNSEESNKPTTLAVEQDRMRDFITATNQRTWTILDGGQTIGFVWIEIEPTQFLKEPALHIMIGDKSARGKGLGKAVLQSVLDLLMDEGQSTLYSRHLTTNQAAKKLLGSVGFLDDGDQYKDQDKLEWQNVRLVLHR